VGSRQLEQTAGRRRPPLRGFSLIDLRAVTRGERGAFSLIELLVVVSVLSVLLALLAPSLRKAREGAQTAACAANLRAIGVGFAAYAAAEGSAIAHPDDADWHENPLVGDNAWYEKLQPYVHPRLGGHAADARNAENPAMCPSLTPADRAEYWRYTTYQQNDFIWYGYVGEASDWGDPQPAYVWVRTTDLKVASDTINILEWRNNASRSGWRVDQCRFNPKHNGTSPWLAFDGHVGHWDVAEVGGRWYIPWASRPSDPLAYNHWATYLHWNY